MNEFVKAREKWEIASGLVDKEKDKEPLSPQKATRSQPPQLTSPTTTYPGALELEVDGTSAVRRLDPERTDAQFQRAGLNACGDRRRSSRALRGVNVLQVWKGNVCVCVYIHIYHVYMA